MNEKFDTYSVEDFFKYFRKRKDYNTDTEEETLISAHQTFNLYRSHELTKGDIIYVDKSFLYEFEFEDKKHLIGKNIKFDHMTYSGEGDEFVSAFVDDSSEETFISVDHVRKIGLKYIAKKRISKL